MVLKVCESIHCTERGVRGRRRGVVFVSVSGENCLPEWNLQNKYTDSDTAACVCLVRPCRQDATELKEAPVLVT